MRIRIPRTKREIEMISARRKMRKKRARKRWGRRKGDDANGTFRVEVITQKCFCSLSKIKVFLVVDEVAVVSYIYFGR